MSEDVETTIDGLKDTAKYFLNALRNRTINPAEAKIGFSGVTALTRVINTQLNIAQFEMKYGVQFGVPKQEQQIRPEMRQ